MCQGHEEWSGVFVCYGLVHHSQKPRSNLLCILCALLEYRGMSNLSCDSLQSRPLCNHL